MKLSEAIRLGAMLRPQGYGFYQTIGGSCALGAALEACGVKPGVQIALKDETVFQYFPIGRVRSVCPICRPSERRDYEPVDHVADAVIHLNDDHRWTREQIAQWVETIERANESPTEPEAALLVLGDARPHQIEEK